jgi:uncharacterized protein (DUF2336 family)
MSMQKTLLTELENAMAHGNAERRAKTIRQVTELFVLSSSHFSDDHVALFDNVFGRLIVDLEASARSALAQRLAGVSNAPPALIRTLAFDDQIDVAGPVLTKSLRLDNALLVKNASTKSQAHLLAIARRKSLDEVVTDVLVQRGDRDVAQCATENPGAKFSDSGYSLLVDRSQGDDRLAQAVGSRQELPRRHFLNLLNRASAEVRRKLEAIDPQNASKIREAVTEAAATIQAKTALAKTNQGATIQAPGPGRSHDYKAALALIGPMWISGRLQDQDVIGFARAGRFDETTVAVAKLCDLPVDIVERAMGQEPAESILIMMKAAGLTWDAARAVLILRAGKGGLSVQMREQSMQTYMQLKREAAQQVVQFRRSRPAPAGPAAR